MLVRVDVDGVLRCILPFFVVFFCVVVKRRACGYRRECKEFLGAK